MQKPILFQEKYRELLCWDLVKQAWIKQAFNKQPFIATKIPWSPWPWIAPASNSRTQKQKCYHWPTMRNALPPPYSEEFWNWVYYLSLQAWLDQQIQGMTPWNPHIRESLSPSLQTPWNQFPAKTEFLCWISSYPLCPKLLYIPFLILHLFSLKTEEFQRKGEIVTEQDPMRPSQDRPFLCPPPTSCS